uniref:Arkadia (RNF111) N-terminal like PKA signaling regulator 2N n=1 Tax=Callorhinchus milii TaxID=7868 RepID=A0A4W3I0G2_CALMI
MKMEGAEKTDFSSQDGLGEAEVPAKGIEDTKADCADKDNVVTVQKETVPAKQEEPELPLKPSGQSGEPCLLMELGQDSESQPPSADSEKQQHGRTYDSDSSNQCMVSPSSSGHLADSDTLSSVEESETAGTAPPEDTIGIAGSGGGGGPPPAGKKSRRSRSESETSAMAPKKNRSCPGDKPNGRVSKARTQKQKERMRLLRQKREAAARKKYTLLQDSSTSDSDLTCDSSTSSSEDEGSGNSKRTISTEIPDGPPVVPHYYISDTNSEPEVLNVDNLLAAAGVQEAFSYGHQEFTVNTVQNRGLVVEKCAPEGQLDEDLMAGDGFADFSVPVKEEIQIASSDSEVEIVGVQEDPRYKRAHTHTPYTHIHTSHASIPHTSHTHTHKTHTTQTHSPYTNTLPLYTHIPHIHYTNTQQQQQQDSIYKAPFTSGGFPRRCTVWSGP